MPYVITEACIGTKDRACVDVCPVDCIYEGPDQLFIHPDECIDCGACEPECPVTAIFPEEDVPATSSSTFSSISTSSRARTRRDGRRSNVRREFRTDEARRFGERGAGLRDQPVEQLPSVRYAVENANGAFAAGGLNGVVHALRVIEQQLG